MGLKGFNLEDLEDTIIGMRNIRGDICQGCGGWGVKTYGSTSTWHGGVGGAAMTAAVCDKCWGSGDQSNPWPSWRGR